MTKATQWTPWAGGDCPPHLKPEDTLEVCTWQGGRYYAPAKWVDWRGRKEDREGIVMYRPLVRVKPTPPTAAKVRADNFYNAGYDWGIENDGSYDWVPRLSFYEFRYEMAEHQWAAKLPRVAEGQWEEGLLAIRRKDFYAFIRGFDEGVRIRVREHEECETPELPPWEYGLCTA